MTAPTLDHGCPGRAPEPWRSPDGRLLLRADAPREQWLAARTRGIGSSDASAVLGLSKWSSPYEVWAEKRGLLPADDDNDALLWGRLLEPIVADWWASEHRIRIRRAGLMGSRKHPWQLASVDRLAECGGIVEIKCVDVATPILTVRGWVPMGDLAVDDEVYAPDGHAVRIVGASPVMSGKDCYEVATSDGRRLVVDAGHLWSVQDAHRNHRLRGDRVLWETITTEELLRRGVRVGNGQLRFRLPTQQALISKPVDLPLDPYLLGAWLGDGDAGSATMTIGDADLADMTRVLGEAGAQVWPPRRSRSAWRVTVGVPGSIRRHQGRPLADPSQDTFTARLRALGVLNNKHVPEQYLLAGTEQRLALLQGLLDTDGGISSRGQVTFCSTTEQLAESMLYLARSLGWSATSRRYERGHKPYWLVRFMPTREDLAPFRLPRKLERVRTGRINWSVRIASITPVESRPVRCIRVDSAEHLFLAGRDLVPTHNTLSWRVAEEWDDGQTPDHAEAQTQHQMAVTGRDHAHVVGLLDGRTPLVRTIHRDDALIADLTAIEDAFWHENVLAGHEPPVDGTAATTEVLKQRWPGLVDSEVDLGAEGLALVEARRDLAVQIADLATRQAETDNRLRQLMGEHTVGTLPGTDKTVTNRRNGTFRSSEFTKAEPDVAAAITHPVPQLDVAALKGGRPELYHAYRARVLRVPTV